MKNICGTQMMLYESRIHVQLFYSGNSDTL